LNRNQTIRTLIIISSVSNKFSKEKTSDLSANRQVLYYCPGIGIGTESLKGNVAYKNIFFYGPIAGSVCHVIGGAHDPILRAHDASASHATRPLAPPCPPPPPLYVHPLAPPAVHLRLRRRPCRHAVQPSAISPLPPLPQHKPLHLELLTVAATPDSP
jgi:hypothetical protein